MSNTNLPYGWDIKSGWLGVIDSSSKETILFPTEEEYDEYVKENEDDNEQT